jgi:xylulose-5-phosphate/fructose-6-phosphate phosphoketolase
MTVMNNLDRFHLARDVIDRVPGLQAIGGHVRQMLQEKRIAHQQYTRMYGEDMPEVRDWHWGTNVGGAAR